MPQPQCARCRQPLAPIYPGQTEHPMCSPTDTGWIPGQHAWQTELPADIDIGASASLAKAVQLAQAGWHVLPLSASKRPLANCPACAAPGHAIGQCTCLPAGRWCHGVRAATTSPAHLATWWRAEPRAVPGVAAGPSGLILVDIDAHKDPLPPDLVTGLLPGIDLAVEALPRSTWDQPARYRDGRDTMRLLAALRGGRQPWPADHDHQPVTVATPSGGRHLWYRAPAPSLRQALADPAGRHGLAWQVDVKAGWSYGVAPGAATPAWTYRVTGGDPARPGAMPAWLAAEVARVATPRRPPPLAPAAPCGGDGSRGAAYLTAVIERGTVRLAAMNDGRKRALAALAYQAGGLLHWSGLDRSRVTDQLTAAGTASGLPEREARRIATRSIARGIAQPLDPPASRRAA
jgi:hypothetical protein